MSNDDEIGDDITILGSRDERELDADDSFERSYDCAMPDDLEQGDYFIIVVADYQDDVIEGDFENDNTRAIPITIQVFPNLQITAASCDPNELQPGETTTVSYEISNVDDGDAGSFRTRFILSSDEVIGDDLAVIGARDERDLESGNSINRIYDCEIPEDVEDGDYFIIVHADYQDDIDEDEFEDDNTRATPITVRTDKVSLDDRSGIPDEYYLSPNFPNPFNAITSIRFGIPVSGFVDLTVWDIYGRRVATIVSGSYSTGNHEVIWNAVDIPTGEFVISISTRNFSAARKAILIR